MGVVVVVSPDVVRGLLEVLVVVAVVVLLLLLLVVLLSWSLRDHLFDFGVILPQCRKTTRGTRKRRRVEPRVVQCLVGTEALLRVQLQESRSQIEHVRIEEPVVVVQVPHRMLLA